MDQNLKKAYKKYGQHVNLERQIPFIKDGLKPVERRVLLSAFEVAKKFVKSAKVDGHIIGQYHPHGSCYGTIVQMVINDFLEPQGNFGSNIGIEPAGEAAMRYTEVKMKNFTTEIGFKYINQVPYFENVLNSKEPYFLSAMFPFCLLGNFTSIGIGFGYKAVIPCFKINDLRQRLMWLLGKVKEEPIIKPITDCRILSDNEKIKNLLRTGKEAIEVEGIIQPIPHKFEIILKSWPPNRKFETLITKLGSFFERKEVGYIDSSDSEVGTSIVFSILRQREKNEVYNKVLKILREKVQGRISFELLVVDENLKVRNIGIDELLLYVYNNFKNLNILYLQEKINKNLEILNEYDIIRKIRPYLSKSFSEKLIKNPDKEIENISKLSNVEIELVKKILGKYTIIRVLTMDIDNEKVVNENKQLEKDLKNIDETVNKQYEELKI